MHTKHVIVSTLLLCYASFNFAQTGPKIDFGSRVRNFGFELLHHSCKPLDDHLIISPYQIWCLMTVISQGAAGGTYEQLRTALNLPKGNLELYRGFQNLSGAITQKSDGVTLTTANYMFYDRTLPIENDYKAIVTTNFDTKLTPIDFRNSASAAYIANDIIRQETDGRITNALNPADFFGAQIILSSVIHFKGMWSMPFNASETKREPFYNDNGTQIGEVNMMYQRAAFPFANVQKLQGFALELPYGQDKKFSMLIILPHYGVSLADMFKNFQLINLSHIMGRIEEDAQYFEGDELDCWIPRFKITTDVVLNKPLNDVGIFEMFDPSRANLSRMSKRQLYVSKVIQKAEIEVTEVGTVASAAASALLPDRIEPSKVQANRPFVYLILEKATSTVLFGGVYSKPSLF